VPSAVTPTSEARPGVVLLVVSAAVFLASLKLFIVNIALPAVRVAFPGYDMVSAPWILNGYSVTFAALLPPAGRPLRAAAAVPDRHSGIRHRIGDLRTRALDPAAVGVPRDPGPGRGTRSKRICRSLR
jgi:hypothetical protein